MKKYDGYALITGGSSGIGLAFAHELAAMGYDLVIVSNIETQLKTAEKELKKAHDVDVLAIYQDLADPESTDIIYNKLQAKKIHVGLLLTNAGFAATGPFHELDRKKMLDMIRVMTISVTDLSYKFLPAMLEKGSGGIIITSSISSQLPDPYVQVYGSSKAYSLKFGISLHAEYASQGIDILTICPAFVDTNIYGDLAKPALKLITPTQIAQQSLAALGKEIVLNIYGNQTPIKLLVLINRLFSHKFTEKQMLKRMQASTIITNKD